MASRAGTRRPTGDDATNARKRFYRSAERYLKQAESSSGATAARYRELARQNFDNAMKTYSKNTTQPFAEPIQKIANALGVDLNEIRQTIKSRTDEIAHKIRKSAIELGAQSKSFKALAGRKKQIQAEQLREDEARAILNSPIGQRILGGTVEIWKESAIIQTDEGTKVDKSKILPALFDYFKADNLADLLEKIEDVTGEILYQQGDKDEMYETAKLVLQNKIASDNAIAA